MRGVNNNKPYVVLDSLLPLHLLDIEGIELELAIAAKSVIWWGVGDKDFSNFNKPAESASQRVKDFYVQHANDKKALEEYAKFAYGIYVPAFPVNLARQTKAADRYGVAREVDTPEAWERNRSMFPSIQRFIDECGAFKTTGRISIIVQHTNCAEPIHADYKHPNNVFLKQHVADAEKEFIWLNPTGWKRLFILDEQTQEKHYVESKAAWFNGLDAHGVDAINRQSWTLRIDGVYTNEFRQKVAAL